MASLPRRIGCVGAGTVGSSWALQFAIHGYPVVMYDVNRRLVENALRNVKIMLGVMVANRVLPRSKRAAALKRIQLGTELTDLEDADYVQESVPERLGVKRDVFAEVERHVADSAIIASSTSGIPMTDIQEGMRHPERAVIAHPFNPPHLLPLVEVVPGKRTSKAVTDAVYRLMLDLGKEPILVKKEVPGFAGNRVQIAITREILWLLENDVVSLDDIEKIFYAGIGLRYATMGAFTIEALNGGPAGLKGYFDHFKTTMETMLQSMTTENTLSQRAIERAVRESQDLQAIRNRDYAELLKRRDGALVNVLKSVGYIKNT